MRSLKIVAIAVYITFVATLLNAEDWTRFRGPKGAGIGSGPLAPVSWDVLKNMKWATELPGPGSSCPIVVQDKVLLTCYTGFGVDQTNPGNPEDLKRHLICFDRESGKELWRSTVESDHNEDPYKGFITHHGYASSTPVTDGQNIFVHFGKTGLVAFDFSGKQIWKQHVGTKSDPAKWGNGSSCIVYKDLVIINAGNTDHSIIAFNKNDGKEVWRVRDEKFTFTWSTPIIVDVEGHDELILDMPGKILAYDPMTGNEIWWAESPIDRTVCGSCVYDNGVVYAMGGREGRAVAVKVGGKGNVTDTHTIWNKNLRSGINTPLIVDKKMYWVATGRVFCVDCESGEYLFRARLPADGQVEKPARGPSGDYASPVAVGDKILLVTKTGATHVIKATEEYEHVGLNKFGSDSGRFNATPAISNGQLFVRSDNKLYCIAGS